MSLRFFNTYSRAPEEFRPIAADGRTVKMYTCGPTVYSYAHIGNFRAYLFEDLLQRHLELRGFKVQRVMNITDVDDKTIRGCQEAGVPLAQFTEPFTEAFFDDLAALRIKRADNYPRATEEQHVAAMIAMIGTLIERGLAYQAEDKSVYFRIKNFAEYGRLAHFNLDELQSTGRVKNDEYEKESVGDFALWKAWDEADGPVRWDSPWGSGRPGWHIECSAMATQLLGEQLDIHCGGVDNIFPHHEAEIAQTEGVTGKQFVRYWMHCAHLQVDAQKMSKSLGNFYTLRDVLAKGYTGREVRYALMRVHYRAPLNFTWEGMDEARQALGRIDEWVARLRAKAAEENVERRTSNAEGRTEAFEEALDDDLNISAALGFLFETIRQTNRALDGGTLDAAAARGWLEWWNRIDTVLALTGEDTSVPANITALGEARAQARLAKEWRKSDELRDELAALGWEIRDTKDGQKITKRGGA
ncbi:MAG: Cysteinyl-tRNA synthetase [uncultured Chthoniobacterales bacterium]|uniref:Cysteine--tRNA ligase n=1 Tax=uncultured Chthoniobacterales bacterium TaxID=1836801 RepID=A0A6J4H4R3_9BACT|nr:MAG: Cysteinyl-tRNA synthetase [uncultured Chthoniobacterales bacterium]